MQNKSHNIPCMKYKKNLKNADHNCSYSHYHAYISTVLGKKMEFIQNNNLLSHSEQIDT